MLHQCGRGRSSAISFYSNKLLVVSRLLRPFRGSAQGALSDPTPFLAQLAEAGIAARVETEVLGFDFDDFASAWEALAKVTTAQLSLERQLEAKAAVLTAMWPNGDGPRHFRNITQFFVGERK